MLPAVLPRPAYLIGLLFLFHGLAQVGCQSGSASGEPSADQSTDQTSAEASTDASSAAPSEASSAAASRLGKHVGVPTKDLKTIIQQLKTDGVTKIAHKLRDSKDAGDQTLAKSLEHLAHEIGQDPHQLWFQLQARSRYPGLEAYRAWLEKQRPSHSMKSLTSLPMLPPCVQRCAHTDARVRNLRVSRDGKTLWVSTFQTLEVIDLDSWTLLPEHYTKISQFNRDPVYADASPFNYKRENTEINLQFAKRQGTNAETVFVDGVRFLGRRDIAQWMVNSIEGLTFEIISAWEDESGNDRRLLANVLGKPKIISYKRDTMETAYEKALPEDVTYYAIEKDRIYGSKGSRLIVFDLQGRPIAEGDAATTEITVAIPFLTSNQAVVGDIYGMVQLVNLDQLSDMPQPLPDESAFSAPKGLTSPELGLPLWRQPTKEGYRVVDSTIGKIQVDVTWPANLVGKVDSVGCDSPYETLFLWADNKLVRYDAASGSSKPVTLDPPPVGPFGGTSDGHLSPDGSRLVVLEPMRRSQPRTIQIYDTATGKQIGKHELTGFINAEKLEFGSDNSMVALTVPTADRAKHGELLQVFDLNEGTLTHELNVGMDAGQFFIDAQHHRLFISPKVVESLKKDEGGYNKLTYSWPLAFYDLKTGKQTILRQLQDHARLLGLMSSGKQLLIFYEGSVHVVDLEDPEQSEKYFVSPFKKPPSFFRKAHALRIRSGNQRFLLAVNGIYHLDMVYIDDAP